MCPHQPYYSSSPADWAKATYTASSVFVLLMTVGVSLLSRGRPTLQSNNRRGLIALTGIIPLTLAVDSYTSYITLLGKYCVWSVLSQAMLFQVHRTNVAKLTWTGVVIAVSLTTLTSWNV